MKASATLSGAVRFASIVDGSVLIQATASTDIFCEFIHPINAPIFIASLLASFFLLEQRLRFAIAGSLQCRKQKQTIGESAFERTVQLPGIIERTRYLIAT